MNITISSATGLDVRYPTYLLLQRMLSPLCGLNKGIGFNMRSTREPRFLMAGADLTGVHLLRDEPSPRTGSYHIGGSGVTREEVLIRTLGETIERYAQLVSEVSDRHEICVATYDELAANGARVVNADKLSFFSTSQFARPGFPFHPFDRDALMGWVKTRSLLDGEATWAPAQLVLVGYKAKEEIRERVILPSVTTGTAAHTTATAALRNALLELVQIDAAMGHWYSSTVAPRIVLDGRTQPIERIIQRYFDSRKPQPRFYWLESPDLPAFSIACVIKGEPTQVPAVAVGLGCDVTLVDAMYHALLEAVAVVQLAKVVLFYEGIEREQGIAAPLDPTRILDLDRNVAFYALPEHSEYVDTRFDARSTVPAAALPEDSMVDAQQEVALLVDRFRTTNKDLLLLDLTTADIRALGFTVARVWSPDTISLCLPSAPPLAHHRFETYGGALHENPHPYP